VRLEFHPQTVSDLNQAVARYNEVRIGLGDDLRKEVYAAIDRIRLNPQGFRVIQADVRRSFVHRFPYSVLFRLVGDDLVRILVIRHHRRRAGLGMKRR
jgi:hypothetical protein